MKPKKFKDYNSIYAKDQPEYLQLPVHRAKDGTVTSCWELTWKERWTVLFKGLFYFQQLTFNQQLQPQRPSIKNPLEIK